MGKAKKSYLVAHWSIARGTTSDHPADYFGPMNYFVNDLSKVDPERCYRTESRARKEALKCCTAYWSADVVEVA